MCYLHDIINISIAVYSLEYNSFNFYLILFQHYLHKRFNFCDHDFGNNFERLKDF